MSEMFESVESVGGDLTLVDYLDPKECELYKKALELSEIKLEQKNIIEKLKALSKLPESTEKEEMLKLLEGLYKLNSENIKLITKIIEARVKYLKTAAELLKELLK